MPGFSSTVCRWLVLAVALLAFAACTSPATAPSTATPVALTDLALAAAPIQRVPTPVSSATTAASATSTAAPEATTATPPLTAGPLPAKTEGAAATGEPVDGAPDGAGAADATGSKRATDSENTLAPLSAPAAAAQSQQEAPAPLTSTAPAPIVDNGLPAKKRVIALDPGHGGPESGAASNGLLEKDLNLKIALELADLLRDEGFEVVLTRDTDRAVSPAYTGSGYPGVSRDLQARVDIANAAGASLFLSIHNNGSGDTGQAGTEVWYDRLRDFGDRNLALAQLLQDSIVKRIRGLGYPVVNRGIKDDANFRIFQGRAYNIYVLGPGGFGSRQHVPTKMPGVLGESLILSNPADAAMLHKDSTLAAIAAGYRDAVLAYFERFPD